MRIALRIRANEGYNAKQAANGLTVGELRRWLEDFNDDDEIVTHDLNNGYGADWGHIEKYDMTEDCPDEDDEDE